MKFSIYITGSPETTGAARSAYNFCETALKKGHTLETVFLMSDALKLATSQSDITASWQKLCDKNGFTVKTCITAMERRGVDRQQLLPYFVADGLASVTNSSLSSDRVITFH